MTSPTPPNLLSDRILEGLATLDVLERELAAGSGPEKRDRAIQKVMERVLRVLRVLGVSSGALLLPNHDVSELEPAVTIGKSCGSISLSPAAVEDLVRCAIAVLGTAPSRSLARMNRRLSDSGMGMWMPLVAGGRVCGLLAVGVDKTSEDSEATAIVLPVIGRQFALLLRGADLMDHNRRSTFELNRKVLELETVYDTGLTLSASLQVEEVTAEILELAVGVVDGRAGFLFLKRSRSGRPELVHQIGLDDRHDLMGRSGLRKHLRRVLSEQRSIHLAADDLPKGVAEAAVLMAPVGDLGCIGVIDKESRTGMQPFGDADAHLLELIGQQAGAALANARLYRDIVEIKNQNENILSSIGNGVISTDLKGKVTHHNPAVVRIFGDQSPASGKSCARFFSTVGCKRISSAVSESLKDGEARQVDGEVVDALGVTLDCRITALADESGSVMGVVVTLEDLTEEMRVRSMFRQYASDQVVDLLLSDRSTPSLGGEEREVTVLFVDIRQSTTLLSRIGPEGMVTLLNECFAKMNEIIFEHNGTLDKYTGDGFMVVYGAPVSFPDDTERAIRTAVEMQKELKRFNRGKVEPLPLAFGISRGRVVAGNVGSLRRMEYTCIGPGVVRASRLCDAADGGEILIDASVYENLTGDYPISSLGWQRFKGVDPIQVYRVESSRRAARPVGDAVEALGERYVDLTIPMLPEMEVAATKTVEAVAQFSGLSEDKTEEVKLALIEACINSFEHSRSKDQVVRINFKVEDDALRILISDSGRGFDLGEARATVAEKRRSGEQKRGWGLKIMEGLVDEVRVHSGDKGTTILLVKHR